MCARGLILVGCLCVVIGDARAQEIKRVAPQVGGFGQAVTVQLPTFSFFSVSTTISIPDRGSAYLGGVNSGASASNQFGSPLLPLRNRASGVQRGASGISVSVWIHDFESMDDALLAEAAARRGEAPIDEGPQLVGSFDPLPVASVADIESRHAEADQQAQAEVIAQFEKAQSLYREGKHGAAKIYYRMALRRAQGDLRQQILAALEAVGGARVAESR